MRRVLSEAISARRDHLHGHHRHDHRGGFRAVSVRMLQTSATIRTTPLNHHPTQAHAKNRSLHSRRGGFRRIGCRAVALQHPQWRRANRPKSSAFRPGDASRSGRKKVGAGASFARRPRVFVQPAQRRQSPNAHRSPSRGVAARPVRDRAVADVQSSRGGARAGSAPAPEHIDFASGKVVNSSMNVRS
jgi:hypothetical protein